MKHQRIAIAVLLILAVLAAEWAWLQFRDQPSPGIPVATAPGHVTVPGGPFALTDHRGQARSDRDFRGGLVLVVTANRYIAEGHGPPEKIRAQVRRAIEAISGHVGDGPWKEGLDEF